MKTQLYKIVLLFICIPFAVHANDLDSDKYEKTKTLHKEYTVNSNATLTINNKYGNINVITWNENRTVIDVKITVSGNDESKVIAKLKTIDVEFDGAQSYVSAKTKFQKSSMGWGKNNKIHYKIHYTIKTPIGNKVNLNNDYGSIYLNELDGDANLNCDYGNIIIGELNGSNNDINIDYCNGSTVSSMKGGSVNADYSKLSIGEAGKVDLNADYSTITLSKIGDLDYNADYGSMNIGDGGKIKGTADYNSLKIGSIAISLDLRADYGSLKIERLKDNFKSINVNGDYCGIKIGVPNSAFNFVLDLKYGGFKRDANNYEFKKQITKSSAKYYEGFYKKANSNSTINISSQYGGVTFY